MMKTHDIASALMSLARLLKAGQNVELKDWTGPSRPRTSEPIDQAMAADAGLALNILVGLSRYNKGQWRSLIEAWGLPVEVRQSDSVRDLLGRLLNYLEEHPDVAQRIKNDAAKTSTKASPELMKIFSILLGGDKQDKDDEKGGEDDKRERSRRGGEDGSSGKGS
jgi:hypothetical protein